MKIEFDPCDLKKKYQTKGGDQTISTHQVSYEHLNAKARKILDITGRAVFWAWDRQTYNAVFPPTPKRKS
jgi:hypothetical protein